MKTLRTRGRLLGIELLKICRIQNKNKKYRQKLVAFQKSQKSAKSLHLTYTVFTSFLAVDPLLPQDTHILQLTSNKSRDINCNL